MYGRINADGSATVETNPAPRCDRCKHWGVATWSEGVSRGSADWRFGGAIAGGKHCLRLRAMVGEQTTTHDTGGETTELFTLPDFGCSLFEAKP